MTFRQSNQEMTETKTFPASLFLSKVYVLLSAIIFPLKNECYKQNNVSSAILLILSFSDTFLILF
jgi:hypothetical protein